MQIFFCGGIKAIGATDTARIYFRLDVPILDAVARQKIDSLLYYDVISPQHELLIVGYADYLGADSYNKKLSETRANNVRAYLQSMGIPEKHITLCLGKGEVPRDVELPDGYAADRRVDIVRLEPKRETRKAEKTKKVVEREPQKPMMIESKDAVRLNTSINFEPDSIFVGQLFVLDKIFFYTGRHKVTDESIPELERLYTLLDEHFTLVVRIEGHVCCVHPSVDALDMDTGEVALSFNRAKYIYKYLVKKGIDPKRLTYEGYGKTRPLRINEFTQEDQDMNKRVEIRVLKK